MFDIIVYLHRLHDTNDDKHLDGIELLHVISHGLDEQIKKISSMEMTAELRKMRMDLINRKHVGKQCLEDFRKSKIIKKL